MKRGGHDYPPYINSQANRRDLGQDKAMVKKNWLTKSSCRGGDYIEPKDIDYPTECCLDGFYQHGAVGAKEIGRNQQRSDQRKRQDQDYHQRKYQKNGEQTPVPRLNARKTNVAFTRGE